METFLGLKVSSINEIWSWSGRAINEQCILFLILQEDLSAIPYPQQHSERIPIFASILLLLIQKWTVISRELFNILRNVEIQKILRKVTIWKIWRPELADLIFQLIWLCGTSHTHREFAIASDLTQVFETFIQHISVVAVSLQPSKQPRMNSTARLSFCQIHITWQHRHGISRFPCYHNIHNYNSACFSCFEELQHTLLPALQEKRRHTSIKYWPKILI